MINRNEIPNFGERLKHLIGNEKCKKKGFVIDLAKDMIDKGVIEPDYECDQNINQCLNSTIRSIRNHLKCQSCDSISAKWIIIYMKYFNCSADYLIGDLPTPTHSTTDICQKTGLSEPAAEQLQAWTDQGYDEITDLPTVLSSLITHEKSPKLLNYIMLLRNAKNPETEQIEKRKNFAEMSGIKESESAVSQSFKDRADVSWMRATQTFQNILDDISE